MAKNKDKDVADTYAKMVKDIHDASRDKFSGQLLAVFGINSLTNTIGYLIGICLVLYVILRIVANDNLKCIFMSVVVFLIGLIFLIFYDRNYNQLKFDYWLNVKMQELRADLDKSERDKVAINASQVQLVLLRYYLEDGLVVDSYVDKPILDLLKVFQQLRDLFDTDFTVKLGLLNEKDLEEIADYIANIKANRKDLAYLHAEVLQRLGDVDVFYQVYSKADSKLVRELTASLVSLLELLQDTSGDLSELSDLCRGIVTNKAYRNLI